jgi:uncharacterized membrane protein
MTESFPIARSVARARSALLWLLTIAAAAYGVWAMTVAAQAALAALGLTAATQDRSIPPLFALHAATGGIALAAGALQFRRIRATIPGRARLHRSIGRTYLYAAWATSVAGLAVTASFSVGASAKVAFMLEAVLWFAATTLAYRRARRHDFTHHREWMIRSYALALFFVTFSVIQPTLDSAGLSRTVAYTIAVLTSTAANLAGAEWFIRRSRRRRVRPATPHTAVRTSEPEGSLIVMGGAE